MFELFFVMAVIGVIIVLSVIALDKIKSDSRDKQRVSQVQSFINAFEIYYSEYGEYPSGDISTVDRTPVTIDVAAKTLADSGFLQSVPEDPIYVGTDGYLYCTTPDNKTMAIIVNIENSSGTSHCVVSRGVDVYSADLCPVVQLLDKCNGGF